MNINNNDETSRGQELETRAQPWKKWFIPEKPVSTDYGQKPVVLSSGDGQGSLPTPLRDTDLSQPKPRVELDAKHLAKSEYPSIGGH
ncbi:hypothetical protein CORC01_09490 [Colletotrichum orchidophilum]|uniref:Uncharacterized protein n=1 Tax=Colletotrichum orchidophilum TaxID=1209926 RepID=A0A1G4B1B6_9PEZI|nr:uncharacterized protein CORC01_09490 [Colletotrichum orchidophilum]OHE95229.1 hypothetical protein CORC01_09490 [Colletotrichum orchidophilum]